jgi:hypothetical protein
MAKSKNKSVCCTANQYIFILLFIFGVVVFYHYFEQLNKSGSKFTKLSLNRINSLRLQQQPINIDTNNINSISTDEFHSLQSTTSNRPRIAFIISITKDGLFQDGAAVLVYSIIKYTQKRDFDVSFIAFVHPNVTTSRSGLEKLGFHVIETPIPINTSAITFEFLREKINKNGCCGAAELIKLSSYRFFYIKY